MKKQPANLREELIKFLEEEWYKWDIINQHELYWPKRAMIACTDDCWIELEDWTNYFLPFTIDEWWWENDRCIMAFTTLEIWNKMFDVIIDWNVETYYESIEDFVDMMIDLANIAEQTAKDLHAKD